MKKVLFIPLLALLAIVLAGCTGQSSGVRSDQQVSQQILKTLDRNQPVPYFSYSQYRQTLIDVETAEAHGVATTTFFYNQGDSTPIASCPSIGFPVPITAQLTNPEQAVTAPYRSSAVVGQLEPNGAYSGDSTGTYVVCVDSSGNKYVHYWEGFVDTIGGPAHFDKAKSQIVLDGKPTVLTGGSQK